MTTDTANLQSRINALESAARIAQHKDDFVFAQQLKDDAEYLARQLKESEES